MTRNERFNKRLVHNFTNCNTSDCGQSVERLIDAIDGDDERLNCELDREELELDVLQVMFGMWLELVHHPELVPTFDLICANRSNRNASINALAGNDLRHWKKRRIAAERRYFRHLKLLKLLLQKFKCQ